MKDSSVTNSMEEGEVAVVQNEKFSLKEHHHHHHHRRSKKRKRSKLRSFLRHNYKKVWFIATVLLTVGALVFAAVLLDRRSDDHSEEAPHNTGNSKETENSMIIEVPFFKNDVSLVSPAVNAYMKADVSIPANEIFASYRGDDNKRLDVHAPLQFSYSVKGLPDGYSVKKAQLWVAENDAFTNALLYELRSSEPWFSMNYLKTGKQYYYRLKLTISNGSTSQIEGSFKTAETPRILAVEGLNNVRDIGGWKTANGREIKQGLLYRGTEMDGAVQPQYTITQNGVNTMLTDLGIHSVLDLRSAENSETGLKPLGVGVRYHYYTASAYTEILTDSGKKEMGRIFSDLADAGNYPAYVHCTYGLDRTGTVCYLLEALLGVSEEDLMRDYQLSSLHHGDISASLQGMNALIAQLKTNEGDTMQKKAENYLLSCGVTQEEIENIRSIFLAD